jgi:cytochrome c oxidase subunit 4
MTSHDAQDHPTPAAPAPEVEGAPEAPVHGHGELHVHALPLTLLGGVFLALLLLTWATVAATWVDLGDLNIVIALAIVVVKASLVCLYFMHLRYDSPFNGFVVVASLAFVALLIGIVLIDTREYAPAIEQYIARQEELQAGTP